MNPLKIGQQLTVKIENLSFGGGRGVARHQGFVLFIPFVLPGEEVLVEVVKVKKSFGEAKVIEILNSSSKRVPAPCPYFTHCGGCTWQHIEYSEQTKIKESLLKNFLKDFPSIEWLPIVPCSKIYHYRNRIQLHKLGSQIGYFKRSEQNLIAIDDCKIAEELINEYLPTLSSLEDGRYEVYKDTLGHIDHRKQNEKSEALMFSQVNSWQNQELLSHCKEWISDLNGTSLLELFCGAGNFTFPIAEEFPHLKIIAIDGSKKLIQLARKKELNENLQFVQGDLKTKILPRIVKNKKVDIILLDPPRVGCSEKLLDDIVALKADSLIYISCNPSTLIRDLKILKKKGYEPKKSQAFDMFPQTDHIESMTLVSRLNNKF
ncbi:MAG: class I SAM-dependent RNA methyltransferase [Bdellovibrionaceae bacterium]|nr:class I SAM-dependent RNA methyltransferase [Pseudobdellovibrionaceae bacterium]